MVVQPARVIVRVSEAQVLPGRREEFLGLLRELVAGFPDRLPGLLGHDVLLDRAEPDRVVYLSRWRDEASLVGFAGPGWATSPVTFPGEEDLLVGPLSLRHLVVDDGPSSSSAPC